MKIEKLTDNKIRIILNLDDLKEKNIDYHAFMSNSIESQDLFLDMLDKAEKEVGFITKDYKLMLEAIATSDGNFIITVTRINPEVEKFSNNKKIQIKRRATTPSKSLAIYKFNTFDNFCDFCTYLNTSPLKNIVKRLKNATLYEYNSNYYLVFHNITISLSNLKSLHLFITEFGSSSNNTDLFERKLIEYGKVIIQNNAVNTCIEYF